MKKIEAVIRPFKLEDVVKQLRRIRITADISVTNVKGFGRQRGCTEIYRGSEYGADFVPKVKLEIVVEDDKADEVVTAIRESAQTGKIGDGKIMVSTVEMAT